MTKSLYKKKKAHKLKTEPKYFEKVLSGDKRFSIRKNDRRFRTGDLIIKEEFNGLTYTGRTFEAVITYITDYMQKPGYIVFGFKAVES